MSIISLGNALLALRAALKQDQVLGAGEELTVELPWEAGRRFEAFILASNEPKGGQWWFEIDWRASEGKKDLEPFRKITLAGCTVRWPVGRVMTLDGPIPRPLPDMVACGTAHNRAVQESQEAESLPAQTLAPIRHA